MSKVLLSFLLALVLVVSLAADPQGDAKAAMDRKDYAAVLTIVRPYAEKGDAWAQNFLGFMYDNGEGVPQDYAQALTWYRKAADQGLAKAQTNIGVMYCNGTGVPQDYAQAITWFRKAADQGLAEAQDDLGVIYENGYGVPQDYTQAITWFRKAADQGDEKAQHDLKDAETTYQQTQMATEKQQKEQMDGNKNQAIKDEISKLQLQKTEIEAKIADLQAKLSDSGTLTYNAPAEIARTFQKAKLPENIKAIAELSISAEAFVQNNPFGFEKNVAYIQSFGSGQVVQWLSENNCLYNFAGAASSELYWSCIGYLDLGEHNGKDLLSGKYTLLFEYVGVFTYQTVNGSENTVPKFKVIFYD